MTRKSTDFGITTHTHKPLCVEMLCTMRIISIVERIRDPTGSVWHAFNIYIYIYVLCRERERIVKHIMWWVLFCIVHYRCDTSIEVLVLWFQQQIFFSIKSRHRSSSGRLLKFYEQVSVWKCVCVSSTNICWMRHKVQEYKYIYICCSWLSLYDFRQVEYTICRAAYKSVAKVKTLTTRRREQPYNTHSFRDVIALVNDVLLFVVRVIKLSATIHLRRCLLYIYVSMLMMKYNEGFCCHVKACREWALILLMNGVWHIRQNMLFFNTKWPRFTMYQIYMICLRYIYFMY